MPEYRVLRGTYRKEDGTRAEPGDIVEMSEERRSRLPNEAYELVEDEDEPEPVESAETEETETVESEQPTDETESETVSTVSPESVLPYDDYRLLSKMAALHDGDEPHGAMSGEEITDAFEVMDGEYVADLLSQAQAELGGDG